MLALRSRGNVQGAARSAREGDRRSRTAASGAAAGGSARRSAQAFARDAAALLSVLRRLARAHLIGNQELSGARGKIRGALSGSASTAEQGSRGGGGGPSRHRPRAGAGR